MRKTLLVMRHEIVTMLSRPMFTIFFFVIPVGILLLLAGIRFAQTRLGWQGFSGGASERIVVEASGFVDPGGLIRFVPEEVPADRLVRFADEDAAQRALRAGRIGLYYLISADYMQSGRIIVVYPDLPSFVNDRRESMLSLVLLANLLPEDPQLARRVDEPIADLQETVFAPQSGAESARENDCSRPGSACDSNYLVQSLPTVIAVFFAMAIMSGSGMLVGSFHDENENRTIEVLLLSISARQMLAGKLLGLGMLNLFSTLIWLGTILLSLNRGGSLLSLPEGFTFPVQVAGWGFLLFIGGFLLYAAIMIGIGVLLPRAKGSSVLSMLATSPLLFGYFYTSIAPQAGARAEPWTVAFSLFPLTAPEVMVMRLAEGAVPLWQLLLSVALTYLAAFLCLRALAAAFRAQTLLAGSSFSLRRTLRALAGKG